MAIYLKSEAEIETMSVEQAKTAQEDDGATIVDLRDVRELWRDGKITGAVHAPRGEVPDAGGPLDGSSACYGPAAMAGSTPCTG